MVSTGAAKVCSLSGCGRFQVCVRSRGRAYGRTHRTLEAAQAEAAELREHLFGEFAGKG